MKKTIILLSLFFMAAMSHADSNVTAETAVAASSFPAEWAGVADAKEVSLPAIPAITNANTFDITAYGASTSAEDNTAAIQAALNAVPSAGGMVVIPKGEWLCGAITVKTKTVLHLAAGATLKQLPYGKFDGGKLTGTFNHFITVSASDVIIEGESQQTSIIDGQGEPWWRAVEAKVDFKRGSIIRFTNGSRYLVRNLRTQNSPGTNITLGQSGKASHMTVHDVTISNPSSVCANPSHNTDGIPMWGPYINVYDCNISTGDDNIVADSNTRFCHAWNLTFGSGHGASFGSYTENVHHIIYEGITFNKTETGFRLKSSRGRSGNNMMGTNGAVSNIIMRNSTMTGVLQPIMLTQMYDSDKADASTVVSEAVDGKTPEFSNILFQNITSTGTGKGSSFKYGSPIYIYGLPESYIHDITFDNVKVTAQKGAFLAYCKDISFINGCNILNVSDETKPVSYSYKASTIGDMVNVTEKTLVWDFHEFSSAITLDGNSYPEGYEYKGLILKGLNTSDNVSKNGFAMNGNSSTTGRYIRYTPQNDGTITVSYKASMADNNRITAIGTEPFGGTADVKVGERGVVAFGYTSGKNVCTLSTILKAGTTYYIFFPSGKQSITSLYYTYDPTTAISVPAAIQQSKQRKAVKYFKDGRIVIGTYDIQGRAL